MHCTSMYSYTLVRILQRFHAPCLAPTKSQHAGVMCSAPPQREQAVPHSRLTSETHPGRGHRFTVWGPASAASLDPETDVPCSH